MKLIRNQSEFNKYKKFQQERVNNYSFNHSIMGDLAFPLFVSSYIIQSNSIFTINHIIFNIDNAKMLLNQSAKKSQRLAKRFNNKKVFSQPLNNK